MEIFVNKIGSNQDIFLSFLRTLEAHDSYCVDDDVDEDTHDYLIIDNEDNVYWFETKVREDRQLSHYVVLNTDADVAGALKMVRNESFARASSGKLQWSLMDHSAMEPMIRVLEEGAKKYDRDNWKKGKPNKAELLALWDCAHRHLIDIKNGIQSGDAKDIYDKDLGANHIGNCMCNLMFMGYHMIVNGDQEIFNPNK